MTHLYAWLRSELSKYRNIVGDITDRWSDYIPDSKVHGANIGPTWGRQDPVGPYVGHVNLANWDVFKSLTAKKVMKKSLSS